MVKRFRIVEHPRPVAVVLSLLLLLSSAAAAQPSLRPGSGLNTRDIPFKIVHESYRQTDGKKN